MFYIYIYTQTVTLEKPRENARYKLNSIKCTNYGSIISGGNEEVIYITTPTKPSKIIAKIADTSSEITSVSYNSRNIHVNFLLQILFINLQIDYQNNTLFVGYVNSDVQAWKKK